MASDQGPEGCLKAALADRFRIESEIGSGGIAMVYLAEDLKHNRRVAIKALLPSPLGGSDRGGYQEVA
jgi:hypothetical protein